MSPERRAIWTRKTPVVKGGKWGYESEVVEVIVMATAKSYAMVRRPKCAPFVVATRELKEQS